MQSSSCAECLREMARGKSDLLVRIACANCRHAQDELAKAAHTLRELSSRTILGVRCSQCGKWCLTNSSLATHRRAHAIPFR